MNFAFSRILLSALFLSMFFSLSAQPLPLDQAASLWFQEERFMMADRNDDARLDLAEMAVFSEEFSYFLEKRRYEWTDRNQDGLLSFSEIQEVKDAEMNFRFQRDRSDYQELVRQYPLLNQADATYLKSNPELVRGLFSNFTWMMENSELAASVYNDFLWKSRNPEAMLSLHRNLRWMVVNPDSAKQLYRDRSSTQKLPEFLAWRADHQDFIRRFPSNGPLYKLDFIHAGIKIRR